MFNVNDIVTILILISHFKENDMSYINYHNYEKNKIFGKINNRFEIIDKILKLANKYIIENEINKHEYKKVLNYINQENIAIFETKPNTLFEKICSYNFNPDNEKLKKFKKN